MSVQSNITRIEGGKASLKTSINNKLNSTQQKITNEHIEDYHLFVDQISGGGGHGTIVPLSVTTNGTYTASGSTDGYSPITVNVPQTGQILPEGWVMQQGEFTVDEDTECWYDTTTSTSHQYTLTFPEVFAESPQIFLVKLKNKTPYETSQFSDKQFISANKQLFYFANDNLTSFTDTRYAIADDTAVNSGNYQSVTLGKNRAIFGPAIATSTGPVYMPKGTTYTWAAFYIPYIEAVHCTGITLNKTQVGLICGGTTTITATLAPSNTSDRLTVVSSDESVSVTLNGNVATITAGNDDGSATITFTCGSQTATCNVTVAIEQSEVTLDKSSAFVLQNMPITAQTITATTTNDSTVTWNIPENDYVTTTTSGNVLTVTPKTYYLGQMRGNATTDSGDVAEFIFASRSQNQLGVGNKISIINGTPQSEDDDAVTCSGQAIINTGTKVINTYSFPNDPDIDTYVATTDVSILTIDSVVYKANNTWSELVPNGTPVVIKIPNNTTEYFVNYSTPGGTKPSLETVQNYAYQFYGSVTRGITFDINEASMEVGDTLTLRTQQTPVNGTSVTNYSVSPSNVVTLTQRADNKVEVNAIGNGTATVTAKSVGLNSNDQYTEFTDTCVINVSSGEIHCTSITLDQHTLTLDEPTGDKPCTAITLDKSTTSVGIGETITVTATLTPSDTTDTLTVTSSDTTKATVTLNGNVATITGVADGSSNITFTCGDINQTCACTVGAAVPVTSIKAGGQYNRFLLSDVDGTKEGTCLVVVPTPNASTTTTQPSAGIITIADESIAKYNGTCTTSSSGFEYDFAIQPKVGSTTFTYFIDGVSESDTRTIEVVNAYKDLDLITKQKYVGWTINFSKHTIQPASGSSYARMVYKVTPGKTYTISGHKTSGTSAVEVVAIADYDNLGSSVGKRYTIIGDDYLYLFNESAEQDYSGIVTIPQGAEFIAVRLNTRHTFNITETV